MSIEIDPPRERFKAIVHVALVTMSLRPQPWSLTEIDGVWTIADSIGKSIATATSKELADALFEAGQTYAANPPEGLMPPDPDYD